MPNVYITPEELKTIKLLIENDIDMSEFSVPDYDCVDLMKYNLQRAEVLAKVTYYIEDGED